MAGNIVKPFSSVTLPEGRQPGWSRGDGDVILRHPQLGVFHHVAICKPDATPLWDQPLHQEPIGAITVPTLLGDILKVGLVNVWRPSFKEGVAQTWPNLDVADLGRFSWEFPRGFPFKGELPQETAEREAGEETGRAGIRSRKIGEVTANTTFHPHRIPVFRVVISAEQVGAPPPDLNEKILKVEWLTVEQARDMVRRGEIYCGLTLAAIGLCEVKGWI